MSRRHVAPGAGWRALIFLTALGLGYALTPGCAENTTGIVTRNRPPNIRITSGPIDDSLHVYRISFFWTADDPDGEILGYEYAVDDTTVADSLRSLRAPSVTLIFPADEFAETITEVHAGLPRDLHRFGRHHTFHVRAIDDRGMRSAFATAAFNAVTIAPTSEISLPSVSVASVHTAFDVEWQSEDIDGDPPRLFSTRLVPVSHDSLLLITPDRLDCEDCALPWSDFVEGNMLRVRDLVEGNYLLGVRAMDEAGAVEPELRFPGNVVKLRVFDSVRFPVVHMTALGKTAMLPSALDEEKTFDLVSGKPATLAWEADASRYGSRIVSTSYGIDLDDLDPDNPDWIPLGRPRVTVRLTNPEGVAEVEHDFYLLMRDSADHYTVTDLILRVGPEPLTLDILYVDDVGREALDSFVNPSDQVRDSFITEIMLAEAHARGLRVDQYEVQNTHGAIPGRPTMNILQRYKLLVWVTGKLESVFEDVMRERGGPSMLHRYVEMGGNVMIMGWNVARRSVGQVVPTTFGLLPGTFGYEYLHIESQLIGSFPITGGFTGVGNNLADRRVHGMDGAIATTEAATEGWPDLLVVQPPYTATFDGIPGAEAMIVGYTQRRSDPGDLDTLYTYVTNGSRLSPPLFSSLHGNPCAFRYEGPEHGKVMTFLFPMFWWSESAAESLGTRAIEWFFDE